LAAAGIYLLQRQRSFPDLGWPTNLTAAIDKARKDNTLVAVFLSGYPKMTSRDGEMIRNSLANPGVGKLLDELRYVRLHLELTDERKARYGLTDSPAMVFLNGNGKVVTASGGLLGAAQTEALLRQVMEDYRAGKLVR